MTISNTQVEESWAGDNSSLVFDIPFQFLNRSDLVAVRRSPSGAQTEIAIIAHTGGNGSTGTVTLSEVVGVGNTLVIYRETAATQESDYTPNDPFPAQSHERALDKLTLLIQELQWQTREDGRFLQFPRSERDSSGLLPNASTRQGMVLGFDENSQLKLYSPNAVSKYSARQQVFTAVDGQTEFTVTAGYDVGFLHVWLNGVKLAANSEFSASDGETFVLVDPAASGDELQVIAFGTFAVDGNKPASQVVYTPPGANVDMPLDDILDGIGAFTPEAFGAVGNGVVDDKAAFDLMFSTIPNGSVVRFSPGANYRLSSQSVCGKSVTILGRGASVSGTGALLGFLSLKTTLSSGPYGTTEAGQAEVTLPTGLAISAGDLLVLESDTIRLSYGSYKWGQVVLVKAYTSGTGQCLVAQPVVGSFQIDRIKIYAGNRVHISDLTFDNSAATTGSSAIGMAFRGEHMAVDRCRFIGATEAAQGLDAIGHMLRVRESRAYGYLHYSGTSGSRLGYGWNLVGDDCEVLNCNGERNKHSVDSASRSVVTRRLAVIGGSYVTPKSQVAGMAMAGSDPLYQYQVGCHANVLDFEASNLTVDGINSLIGFRNGRAAIHNVSFYSRDTQANDRVNDIVLASEAPVTDLVISGARVYVDPGAKTSSTVFFGGLEVIDGTHRNIVLRDIYIDGGYLVRLPANASAGSVNVDGLTISGIRGKVARLLEIGGSGNTRIDNISNVTIEDAEVGTETGAGAGTISDFVSFLRVQNVTNVVIRGGRLDHTGHDQDKNLINIDIDGTLDGFSIEGTSLSAYYGGVRMKAPTIRNIAFDAPTISSAGSPTKAPAILIECDTLGHLKLNRPKIRADYSGIQMTVATGIEDSETASLFADIDISYNRKSGGTLNVQGVYLSCPASWTKRWQFRGGDIRIKEAALDAISQPIRGSNKIRADFVGLVLSDDWAVSDTYDSSPVPVGCLRTDGSRLPWRGGTVVGQDGTLFKSSIPTSGTWAAGDSVRNSVPSASGKIGWICVTAGTPGTWKTWGAIDA